MGFGKEGIMQETLQPSTVDLIGRVRGEFLEMPGRRRALPVAHT